MTTSNTYLFGTNTQIDDLIRESFERIGIIGNDVTGLQVQSAVMSANLELTAWMGRVPLSWLRRKFLISLYAGQPIYQLPVKLTQIIDVVATQPKRLNTGGTAFSSAGGNATNCFTATATAGCTQTAPNGYISYNYGVNTTPSILYVGITPLTQSTYTLAVEYSFDNVNWTTIYTAPSQTYFANQVTGFVISNSLNAMVWRVRETGGATLALQQIYFSQPSNTGTGDRWLTALSYTEWMQIATKMNSGFPSSYFFDAQIAPTITLWPVPNNTYANLLYDGYIYVQDVSALFQQFEVPQRFFEALVSGMAARLAQKFAPARLQEAKALAEEAWKYAVNTDYEDVTLRFQPDFSQYGR